MPSASPSHRDYLQAALSSIAAQAGLQALSTLWVHVQVSAFCISKPAPQHLVRFCFCKTDDKLQEAVRRLRAYLGKQNLSNGHHLNGNSKQ